MFAAKLGHKVLAVEPFYDNILRIHKSSYMEKIHNNIVLIQNAISDKRNEIKSLFKLPIAIGAQSLIPNKEFSETYPIEKNESHKYLVETILFDDIVPYLSNKENKLKKGLLKIDIEGYEPYAFQNANLLFNTIDIQIIFMEWNYMATRAPLLGSEYVKKILFLIEFLYIRGFRPYSDYKNNQQLLKSNWKAWSFDIVWKKCNSNV